LAKYFLGIDKWKTVCSVGWSFLKAGGWWKKEEFELEGRDARERGKVEYHESYLPSASPHRRRTGA
jgi:hypothetical protein